MRVVTTRLRLLDELVANLVRTRIYRQHVFDKKLVRMNFLVENMLATGSHLEKFVY